MEKEAAVETSLLAEDSPYAEVRASVKPYDDPETPVNTIRAWTIGLITCTVVTACNVLLNMRRAPVTISPVVVQLIAYPMGKGWHASMPNWKFRLFGQHFEFNPEAPFDCFFADDSFNRDYKSEIMVSRLSNVFAFLAIFISCLGLFGLAMFMAEQRTREIGIRKVLGAGVSQVVAMLSKDFVALILVAAIIASPIAWLTMNNWLKSFTYRAPIGWWVFPLAAVLALAIALCTISFQAVKAAIANPVKSLRSE